MSAGHRAVAGAAGPPNPSREPRGEPMTDHADVREFLRQMADEVPSSPVEPRPAVRRAKRRLARTLSAVTLVVAAIAVGSVVGIGRLTAAPPSVPAHPGPSVLPTYHHN